MGPDFGTNATDVGLPVTTEVKVTGALEIVLTTRGSHEEYENDGIGSDFVVSYRAEKRNEESDSHGQPRNDRHTRLAFSGNNQVWVRRPTHRTSS